ncbi:DUF423 domain-containing protein [Methylobacterium nigriterrae]|uniref:DUF423 domain-containing protein n=1 Tax=Methylobacterium nigriterrae TaxID=3127512 RepID=UPI0030134A15
MRGPDRALIALAALAGLLGVAASAAAAHRPGDGDTLRIAGQFLLFHAPAVMALTALGAAGLVRGSAARIAAGALLAGLCLFSGDLATRALAQHALFPMAAPSGGLLLMAGWIGGIVAAFLPARA